MDARKKGLARGLIIAAVLAVLGVAAVFMTKPAPEKATASQDASVVGGPFTLVNQDGRVVTDKDFRGHYMMLYFGYTFCPDVCPTELKAMSDGLTAFEQANPALAGKVEPVFITVDPSRDTPAVLKEYVANFHKRLVGLTGTDAQISAVEKEWRVYAQKSGTGPDYLMDHSSMIYLMGPEGKFVTVITNGTPPDQIAKDLAQYVS